MPQFTVIIPTFNRKTLLLRCLSSALAQSYTDYEIIVVDDGSTDGTAEAVTALNPKVRLLKQTNAGPGAARNLGILSAQGPYLAFLDSDDLWFPWTLETYAEIVSKTDQPAFIAGRPWCFKNEADTEKVQREAISFEWFKDYLESGSLWRWWGVSSFVLRRDCAVRAGGFTPKNINGEDADLALKLGIEAGFVQVKAPMTFGYRNHDSNVTQNLDKTLLGLWHKIESENLGRYPGGTTRQLQRWTILTRHLRPAALLCLNRSRPEDAWKLYRASLRWHLALRRWKFLLGFPLASMRHLR